MSHINVPSSRKTISVIYLLGLSIYLLKILFTEEVLQLVHPRFIPFLYTAAILCIFITIALSVHHHDKDESYSILRTTIILFPLVLAFAIPPVDLTASYEKNILENNNKTPSTKQKLLQTRNMDYISLNNINFFSILQDIYDNPESYRGKKLQLTGKIMHLKKSKGSANCAIIRMMMVCCAADMQPVGIIIHTEIKDDLIDGNWVTAEGTLDIQTGHKQSIPVLAIEKIYSTSKPNNEYIYPL